MRIIIYFFLSLLLINLIFYIVINNIVKEDITLKKYLKILNITYSLCKFHLKNRNKRDFKEIEDYIGKKELQKKQKIPYNIYQIFIQTNKVPESMYNITREWIKINPEYNYNFFSGDRITKFIEEDIYKDFNFTKEEFKECYNNINSAAGKADLFRLLLIYDQGGCYFDMDTQPIKPLKNFILEDDEVVSGIGQRNDIHQWGLIYVKNHILIKKTLELAIDNIKNNNFIGGHNSLEYMTGPPCMNKAVRDFFNMEENDKFIKGRHKINGVKFRLLDGDWLGYNICFKYLNYDNDLKLMKLKHWSEEKVLNK